MAVTRWSSQMKPTDSTEQFGYKFFSMRDFAFEPTATTTSTMEIMGTIGAELVLGPNSALPGVLLKTTTAETVYTLPTDCPNDVDSSQTSYLYLYHSSPLITASTTATSIVTIKMGMFADSDLVTTGTSAYLSTTTAFTIAPTAVTADLNIGAAQVLSTTPDPGDIISLQVAFDSEQADAASTPTLHGIMFKYYRRFV